MYAPMKPDMATTNVKATASKRKSSTCVLGRLEINVISKNASLKSERKSSDCLFDRLEIRT